MSVKTQDLVATGQSRMVAEANKVTYSFAGRQLKSDVVIVEQPMQISLLWEIDGAFKTQVFSITMRTPGNDEELICGLLFSEGVIRSIANIEQIQIEPDTDDKCNRWEVKLASGIQPELSSLEKFQMTYSSCGLCGTTSLKSLELKNPPVLSDKANWLAPESIQAITQQMRDSQSLFAQTGSVHAAALFDENGQLIDVKEDIGRHNAVDKLTGAYLKQSPVGSIPLIMTVSGRISFEIVQKAVMAGVCVLVAVGAPSDLAVIAAKRFNLTLIGFAGASSFNLYHGEWRLHSLGESCQKI